MKKINLFESVLKESGLTFKKSKPLGDYSTIKVGGNTDYLVIAESRDQLKDAVLLAKNYKIPCVVIGKGSNVIFSDDGYRGLVIINLSKKWEIIGERKSETAKEKTKPRFKSDYSGFEYKSEGLDFSEDSEVLVRVDSGVGINNLMHALYKKSITGLQWFAGIPATVGGAIYMNMHGGEYFFGDLVQCATLIDGTAIRKVNNNYFKFDYDWSILHETNETILDAELILMNGNLKTALNISNEWARHKSLQPRRSAGCVFKNLSTEEKEKYNLPTTSVGYLIDKVLDLKGEKIGDAIISERHAAFIENLGHASAREVYGLIQLIKRKAKSEIGLELQEEIQLIGKF